MAKVHGISVALLRPLAELLGRLDIDPAEFLDSFGVDARTTPNTYIAGSLVDERLDEIARTRGDPTFALTLARRAVIRPLGLFSHMVWLSGTVRDALVRAVRFYAMVTRRTTLTLDDTGPRATLRQHAVPGIVRGAILTEFAFASLVLRAQRATSGRFKLLGATFSHERDRTTRAAYVALFGVPVSFGAPIDEVAFSADQLDLALESADEVTSAALEATIGQLTDEPPRSVVFDRVRRVVVASLDKPVSLTSVARRLGTSARTLRRQLEREGRSLRSIVDDVRHERADELIASGTPIKEISFGLGFSEPSAFSRAYKRWTGSAPRPTRVK
ncbi:MAG TPA: AraC family transcriptional regulator ligand-binding domain-containing protein [Kofleriaceae bacterium]|jgi:AraC-like DNA-binding protein